MNIANLQILLQKAINQSTRTIDYFLLAKAIQSLNMGQVKNIATSGDFPSASENEGLLVFVENDELLYWSDGTNWNSFD